MNSSIAKNGTPTSSCLLSMNKYLNPLAYMTAYRLDLHSQNMYESPLTQKGELKDTLMMAPTQYSTLPRTPKWLRELDCSLLLPSTKFADHVTITDHTLRQSEISWLRVVLQRSTHSWAG